MKAKTEQTGLRAHLQAGERGNTRAEGSIQQPIGEASITGMLKVPSSSFNVQRTDEPTLLVNSGDFAIAFKEISP